MGCVLPTASSAVAWAFVAAGIALVVILIALGVALVVYQRRFLAMHRTYADGLLAAQEEERAWIAREVHDDALQRILLLIHELDGWNEAIAARIPICERVDAFRTELEDLSASLRHLAYHLHPTFHDQEGIVPMLQRLGGEIEQSAGLKVEVRAGSHPVPPLTTDRSLMVYRIAQEALNNVIRHADTSSALVEVVSHDHTLEVRVEDYGTGFDASRPRKGLGLTSMAERARSAGGILSVESHPGGGTRVYLKLPVEDVA